MITIKDLTLTGTPKPVGADNNAHFVPHGELIYESCTFDANGASEAVKISRGIYQILFSGGEMIGGVEDCEDILGASNIYHHGVKYTRGKAQRDVTIKYGCKEVHWSRCPGLRWITAGDYTIYESKQTGDPVSECSVNVEPGQKRVYVLNLNSKPFTGDVFNIRIPWLWLHLKVVGVYFWIRRTFFKEKGANAAKV